MFYVGGPLCIADAARISMVSSFRGNTSHDREPALGASQHERVVCHAACVFLCTGSRIATFHSHSALLVIFGVISGGQEKILW